jgi:predicted outer membrane repeat protein
MHAAGVKINTLHGEPASVDPLMAFDGVVNNVQSLVITVTALGLEPLLPANLAPEGDFASASQDRLFHIYGLVNLTLANSVIEGLAPLFTDAGRGASNPAVPDAKEDETKVETDARVAKWASHVRVQNCTFRNFHRALIGQSSHYGASLTTSIVEASGTGCMLRLHNTYNPGWVTHVSVIDTTFDNISFSVPPASGLRQHLLCTHPGSQNDTVTVRGSAFTNIKDALAHHDSVDLFWTDMEYASSMLTLTYNIQHCRFVKVRAALLAALEVRGALLLNCTVYGAQLSYGGFAVVSSMPQTANISHITVVNVQLGSANDATAMNQDYFNPGVGLVKTGSRTQAHVESCMFRNISLNPAVVTQGGSSANKSRRVSTPAAFIRTAVIAAAADVRVVQSTFEDCYTPAVVYAFSGEKETLGQVYSTGTANRGTRKATVSLVLHESTFVGNMYGVYADGFQVIISSCRFSASRMFGVHVSGVPCLVMNGTVLHDAAVSVQRASNPGGVAFAFCRMGWFPLWLSDSAQSADVPTAARDAAALHNITGQLADAFDSPVSVYLEGVSISGVQDQAALSLLDIHKASLQRVILSRNLGSGALRASSVAGLLMLQCRVENNSARLVDVAHAVAASIAGGGTFTAVRSLYLLDSVFSGNSGPQAGALLLQSCGPVAINSCTFIGNTAGHSGGAVHATASESIAVDTTILWQPGNISCMQNNVLETMYREDFSLDLSGTSTTDNRDAGCPNASLGGQATTFSTNAAGASGGAIAIEGLTLAAFNASHVNLWDNR